MTGGRHTRDWPSDVELETLGAPDVALGVLDLAVAAPEWVHRRVERVELMTATHFRRRVSLDLTIPVGSAPIVQWFRGERLVLLPLDAIAKRPLADFDLRDEDGRPVPTLTRRQNSHVSWRALCAIARETIGVDVPAEVEHRLRAVTQGSDDSSLGALAHLIDDPGSPAGTALIEDEAFLTVADLLARNFLLVGAFAVDRPVRRIVKFAYEESLSAVTDRSDERTTWERVQESLGLRPTTLQVRVPSFAECESYHFEATAPPGIEFIDVVLGDEYRTGDVAIGEESLAAWATGYRRLLETSPPSGALGYEQDIR